MKAVVRAVADQLKKGNLEFDLGANAGKPVTLLMAADNMLGAPMIFAGEGKPVLKPDTGQWLFMSKGSRKYGYRLNLDHVLDVAAGYNKVDHLRKSTRLNSSHLGISYAVFCLKKKKKKNNE